MNFLYQSAFTEALGWSLIDSLWQMGAIWAFYIMVTGNGSKFPSQKLHSIALLGSAAGTLIFFISLAVNYYSAVNNSSFFSLAYFVGKQADNTIAIADKIVPLISYLYLPAVAFFALRLIVHVSINKIIYGRDLVEADKRIVRFVSEMSTRLRIPKKVAVWISEKVESPLTFGFWKPVIFLPVAVFSHLSCSQVEAVLTHELHHIKRNDYLINIFLTVAGVILFFNPFARMMFATVKKERENSCDDHVIASGFDAWEYSQALYILGKYRNEKNSLAIAATGAGKEFLLERIRRIMKRNNPSPSVLKPFLAFFLCLFVAGFATRNKQIAASPNVAKHSDIKPVVSYYLEDKRISIVENKIDPKKPETKKKKPQKINKTITIIHVDPAVSEEELSHEEFPGFSGKYVAAPQVLEFTMIDPEKPAVPEVICESPQPFIQKSSFYFTEIDTTAGKRVVEL